MLGVVGVIVVRRGLDRRETEGRRAVAGFDADDHGDGSRLNSHGFSLEEPMEQAAVGQLDVRRLSR